MYIKNQKFLVLGISKSGYSATKALLKYGGEVYLYDDETDKRFVKDTEELISLGAKTTEGLNLNNLLAEIDVLLVSPGVAINHSVCIEAKRLNKRIIGELELGFYLLKSPIVAVTGTNGKTTTVSIVDKILDHAKVKHALVGNIGIPICSKLNELDNFDTVAVTEVSSFQLETVHSFLPHIACILNVTPDHLERHYTMENYLYLKGRVLKNLRESEFAVFNKDDLNVVELSKNCRAKKIWFSTKDETADCYLKNGVIYYNNAPIIPTDKMQIIGEHNIYNAMASICIAKALKIADNFIVDGLTSFKGAKHRIESVGLFNGKEYFDDSKGTNTASTISAVKTMDKPTVLILGGKEKGEDYNELFLSLKKSTVLSVVITGESSVNMLKSAINVGYNNVHYVDDLRLAVSLASFLCPSGGNVLFSPACASFDKFTSYAERGEFFVMAVNDLEKETSKTQIN